MFPILFALSDDLLHEQDHFSRVQNPKLIPKLMELQISVVVVFFNQEIYKNDTNFYDNIYPVARTFRGVNPFVYIECSKNHSKKFCQDQKIKQYPLIRMFNQDFKFKKPQDYDEEPDDWNEEWFLTWLYDARRHIFDISPSAEALLPILSDPSTNILVYLTKGSQPPIYQQQICILMSGKMRNVHQPGFDQEQREKLKELTEFYELSRENEDNFILKIGSKFYKYSGGHKKLELGQWLGGKLQENQVGL